MSQVHNSVNEWRLNEDLYRSANTGKHCVASLVAMFAPLLVFTYSRNEKATMNPDA